MTSFIDCPGCWQRKIHASLRYCETCSIVAASTDNLNAALAQLKTVQEERDEQAKRIESLQAQLDLAHKFHDVAVAERSHAHYLFGKVLAVLNGDAVEELGWAEATKRGLERYTNLKAEAAKLRECLETVHYSFKMGNAISGPMLQTWAEFVEKALNNDD